MLLYIILPFYPLPILYKNPMFQNIKQEEIYKWCLQFFYVFFYDYKRSIWENFVCLQVDYLTIRNTYYIIFTGINSLSMKMQALNVKNWNMLKLMPLEIIMDYRL